MTYCNCKPNKPFFLQFAFGHGVYQKDRNPIYTEIVAREFCEGDCVALGKIVEIFETWAENITECFKLNGCSVGAWKISVEKDAEDGNNFRGKHRLHQRCSCDRFEFWWFLVIYD